MGERDNIQAKPHFQLALLCRMTLPTSKQDALRAGSRRSIVGTICAFQVVHRLVCKRCRISAKDWRGSPCERSFVSHCWCYC